MIWLRDRKSVLESTTFPRNEEEGSPISIALHPVDLRRWKAALAGDLSRVILRGGWISALSAVAWVHLVCFLACQAMYDPRVLSDLRHLLIWIFELAAVLGVMRLMVGRRWYAASPAISLVVKLWVTFLILSFNLAMLNSLTGFQTDWFKPVWGTLSTFLFASLAWLFTPRFLILAVQMYFTGLLMVKLPGWNYLIYGLSWWLALQGIAFHLRRQRNDRASAPGAP